MSSDWDEIRKLAADLQSVQLQTTTQKLSDRNCIEIVNYLQKTNRLKLIFTTDGKEYVTFDCLKQEILDELTNSSNGRLTITEIANSLVVDPIHVRKCANELVQQSNRSQNQRKLILLNDSLIGQRYFIKIANEIRDSILDRGIVQLNDIIMKWDLGRDIIERNILPFVTNIIIDSHDSNILYNSCYLDRLQCLMRGYLFAVTTPTRFESICSKIAPNFTNEKLLMNLAMKIDQLPGSFDNSIFMPRIYLSTMAENVQSFMNQNRYITLDNMSRFGVKNPKKFLKSLQLNEPFVFLASCIVSKHLLESLAKDFDECLQLNNWYFDLDQLLPCPMTVKDFEIILDDFLFDCNRNANAKSAVIQIDRFLVTKGLLQQLHSECMKQMEVNVEKIVKSGEYQNHKITVRLQNDKDDLSNDKKNRKTNKKKTTNTTITKLEFVTDFDVCQSIEKFRAAESLVDLDQSLFDLHADDLVSLLLDDLQKEGWKMAETKYQEMIRVQQAAADSGVNVDIGGAKGGGGGGGLMDRKKQIRELENDLNDCLCRFRLMEKGLVQLTTNSDLKQQLTKHLLKTTGTELLGKLAIIIDMKFNAKNRLTNNNNNNSSNKSTEEILKSLAENVTDSEMVTKLIRMANIDDFNAAFRSFCQLAGISLQKTDRKKDRLIVRETRAALIDELEHSSGPDTILLVACQLIFLTHFSGSLLNFSGKFIRNLLDMFVELQFFDSEMQSLLFSYCEMVSKYLNVTNSNTANSSLHSADLLAALQKKMSEVKSLISEMIANRKNNENPEIDEK